MNVANAKAPNNAALRPRPRRRATPTIAPHAPASGEELDETDVAVTVAQDHRGHGLDLGYRREGVEPVVRGVEDVRDGVLLLPERGPWKVVEQRVRQALRQSEARDEQVEMHEHRESRERGDGPSSRASCRARPRGARPGRGRSDHHHTTRARTNTTTTTTARRAASVRARSRERARRRRSPPWQDVDGEEEPDRRPQAKAARREHCGCDDEGKREAQGQCAHVLRLTRSPRGRRSGR